MAPQAGFDGLRDFHVGKKETAKNAKTMLDDKSHVDKSRYLAYANADVGSGSIYDQVRDYPSLYAFRKETKNA